MFFAASKLIEDMLLPSNAIGLVAVLGILLLLVHKPKSGKVVLTVAASLLLVFGIAPVGKAALLVLENRFPQPDLPGSVAGILLLGGAVDTHISAERNVVSLNDAGERITMAAALARKYPGAQIILSGGLGHLFAGHGKTESAYARDLLVQMGVPEHGSSSKRNRAILARTRPIAMPWPNRRPVRPGCS